MRPDLPLLPLLLPAIKWHGPAPSPAALLTLEGFLKVRLSSSCCVAFCFCFCVFFFYDELEINFLFAGIGLSVPTSQCRMSS